MHARTHPDMHKLTHTRTHMQDRDQTQFLGAMTKRFAIELLLGLEAAHVAGLTHGNLVPANVFLSSDGVKVKCSIVYMSECREIFWISFVI